MTSSQILEWLSSHWSTAWPVLSALLVVVLRSRTPEAWVALGESSPRLQGVVRLLRAVGLDPAKAVSALVQIVTARTPERPLPARETVAPPAPVDHAGERGSIDLRGVALILATALCIAGLGATLSGCPRLPPVSGCTPRDYRCTDDGRPQVCSSTQRWQPIGDESCAAAGSVCVVDRTAHCAPHSITLADGGSDAR